MTTTQENFLGAAAAVARCVEGITPEQWEQPGLGAWSVRDLVGHTSRSIVTVLTYVGRTAEREDLATAEAYIDGVRTFTSEDAEQIVERGRQAGRDLGDDACAGFSALVTRVRQELSTRDGEQLLPTILGGMRLSTYLETRTFELVVHGDDLSRATGVALDLPAGALVEAAALAGRVAVLQGRGPELLAALTGRQPLPASFSLFT